MLGPALVAVLAFAAPALAAEPAALASSAPATLHWQVPDLTIVRRVAPAFPAGVMVDQVGDVACRASVTIASNGDPAAVRVEGCAAAFATEAQRAIQQWRWAPWSYTAERFATLTVRFSRPVAAAPVAAPPPPPREDVVCSAEIVRNRQGAAISSALVACPDEHRDRAAEALRTLASQPGVRAAPSDPSHRTETVKIPVRIDV